MAAALSGEERKARLLKFRESLEDGVSVVKFNRRGGVAMRKLFLVMEYAPNGELYKKLQKAGKFSEEVTAKYVRSLSSALAYMH